MYNKAILRGIIDPFYITDATGQITSINEVARKVLGIGEHEAPGHSIDGMIGVRNSYARKALAKRKNYNIAEGKVIACCGREYHVPVTAMLLKDRKGNVTGINSMFKDITTG